MYPETDVPPIRISSNWLDQLSKDLPEPPEERVERLVNEFKVHRQQVQQLVDEGWDSLFEELSASYGNAAVVARTFLNHLPELRAEGLEVDLIPQGVFTDLFALLKAGAFAKEAIPLVLGETVRRGISVEEALRILGLERFSTEELKRELDAIIEEHVDLLRERGDGALKPLMGIAMARVRGRADGRLVNEVLRQKVKAKLQDL